MSVNPDNKLKMTFTPNTIEHLGVRLYSTIPPVIAELIANSYDADATVVNIFLDDSDHDNKKIVVTDNGHGMTFVKSTLSFYELVEIEGLTKKPRSRNHLKVDWLLGKRAWVSYLSSV
jgi:hypothetical protein